MFSSRLRQWIWQRKVLWGNRRIREVAHYLAKRVHHAAIQDLNVCERIQTKAEWEVFRLERLEALRRSLNVRTRADTHLWNIVGTFEHPQCRIDNVVFQSRMNWPVTANFYLPLRSTEKLPAIVICHSHHDSKAEEELQCMGMTWARQGCAVLIMDILGHGERRQHPFVSASDHSGPFRPDRQDYYFRHVLGLQANVIGESLMGWMVEDVISGIGMLCDDSRIDQDRIIILGCVAGGGDLAAVVAALDERVTGAVVFNYGPLSFGDWEGTRNLPGTARSGFWPWVVLASLAPRNLIYAKEFAWQSRDDAVWQQLRKVYGFYGNPGALRSVSGSGQVSGNTSQDTHCVNIGAIHRRQIYPILQEWFGIPIPEREVVEPVERSRLACVSTGWPKELGMLRVHEHAQNICEEHLRRARARRNAEFTDSPSEQLRQELLTRLGPLEPFDSMRVLPVRHGIGRSENVVLEVEESIRVRLHLLKPEGPVPATRPVVVGLAQKGAFPVKRKRRRFVRALLRRGITVCIVEPRGIGDGRHGELYRGRMSLSAGAASTSYMFGENLLCARVRDLRTVLTYLDHREDFGHTRIGLWGESLADINPVGRSLAVPLDATPYPELAEPFGGVTAMLTALLEPWVQAVYVHHGLATYGSVLEEPFVYVPADSIVRGLLSVGDLPDMAAALAPRPLWLQGLVDGCNRSVSRARLKEMYHLANVAYTQKGKPNALIIEAEEEAEQASEELTAGWFDSCLRP